MGIIHDAIFGQINKEASARILVQCPKCQSLSYVFANVTAQLAVIEPDLTKRICKECEQVVTLKRIIEE